MGKRQAELPNTRRDDEPAPPTDPPTVEFKSAQAIYGLTPRTEEECRKQNEPWKPRPALSAPEDADLVEEDPDPVCGGCGKPIREGDAIDDVEVDNDDLETWHLKCAQEHAEPNDDDDDPITPPDPVDSDAPRSPS